MALLDLSAWRNTAVETVASTKERRLLAVRVDPDEGSEEIVLRGKSYPGAEVVPAGEWRDLFAAARPLGDDLYSMVTRFRLCTEGSSLSVGAEESLWTRLEELVVRGWFKQSRGLSARFGLVLKGNYGDSLWPPAVWRQSMTDRRGGVTRRFGYVLTTEANRGARRPRILWVSGRELPAEDAERQRVWDEVFAPSSPTTRGERRKLGRNTMFEIGRTHPVGSDKKMIHVGPKDADRPAWTPHYRWIVRQWYVQQFKPAGYELEFSGSMLEQSAAD